MLGDYGPLFNARRPLTRRTGGTEYVSWAGNDQRAIYFIPTPRAQNIKTSEKAKRESKSSPGLADYIQMFPTPTRFDATCGDLPGKEFTGTRHAMKLIQAAKMWPTPIATDWKNRGCKDYRKNREFQLQTAVGGQLNPDWVEWLQGFPIGWTEA